MINTLKYILGHVIRIAVYTLAGFALYAFIRNGWIVFFTLLISGLVEGYILQSKK